MSLCANRTIQSGRRLELIRNPFAVLVCSWLHLQPRFSFLFRFFTDFDSGNLGRVELIEGGEEGLEVAGEGTRPSTSTLLHRAAGAESPGAQFRLWTRPDCQVRTSLDCQVRWLKQTGLPGYLYGWYEQARLPRL